MTQRRWKNTVVRFGVRMVAASALLPVVATAQERLLGERAIGGSASYEVLRFGGAGMPQAGLGGLDSVRITRATQVAFPVTTAVSFANGWRFDVTAFHASGSVEYRDMDTPSSTGKFTLSGLSDVRVRATGALLRDVLFLTVGANLPTGQASLNVAEFAALRVLSAPALGMSSAPVGAGASGTLGIIYARQLGGWALAGGGSYEHRGRFQPIAALEAGAPSANFEPGGVIRASLSGDRIVGQHRLMVALTLDRYGQDRLKRDRGAEPGTTDADDIAVVQLGPVFSAEAQMQLGTRRLRETVLYAAYRWRSPYTRDGDEVSASSGYYFDGGARSAIPVVTGTQVLLSLNARLHSGLGIDNGLPTAGVAAVGGTVGLDVTRGRVSLQPFVRAQVGSLDQRNAIFDAVTTSFNGAAAGLVLVARY